LGGLSDLERELLDLLENSGSMSLKEIRELNPRFVGALGRLKSKGLIEVIRLPNKDIRIFAKHSLLENW